LRRNRANWNNEKLKDITTKIGSGATPRGGQGAYHQEGMPLIRSKNIYDLNFSYDDLAFINDSQAEQLDNVSVEKDDVLLNITGASVCRCTSVPDCLVPARVNQHVAIIRADRKNLDGKYLKYTLVSPLYKRALMGLATTGATREALTKNDIENFELKLPGIKAQTRIASVLSAYDDLIENNEKRIKILEEMAQLLYSEWFVRFNFPGHEKVKMVDGGTQYGMIPEGWNIRKLWDVVGFLEGPGLRNWQYRDSGIPFLNIRTIGDGDIDIDECNYLDIEEVERKYSHFLLKENDIVISSSGTLGRLATIRKKHLPLCLNTSVIRFREIKDGLPIWFVRQYLLSPLFQNKIRSLASGSAQLNYGSSHLSTISIVMPKANILDEYNRKASCVEEYINNIRGHIAVLRKIRDMLIPQLVTGKRELKY